MPLRAMQQTFIFVGNSKNKVWDYLHQNQGGMAIFGSNNSHVW
ncbi:hypothetical protein [Wolbachia endosymbiont of Phyllotreta cruciferae]|nr:hypothetical protein [Wolbachia endosymbiont of Phyllotreta cruciferae]